MKNCTACNQEIALDVKFCPECGAKQEVEKVAEIKEVEEHQPIENFQQFEATNVVITEKKQLPTIYKILCVLALAGPIHVILIGLFYLIFGSALKDVSIFVTGLLWTVSSLGTIFGTVMLFKKRKKGLVIYTINQVVYILTAIYVAKQCLDSDRIEGIGEVILVLLVLPALIFLGVFWFSKFRNYLR